MRFRSCSIFIHVHQPLLTTRRTTNQIRPSPAPVAVRWLHPDYINRPRQDAVVLEIAVAKGGVAMGGGVAIGGGVIDEHG